MPPCSRGSFKTWKGEEHEKTLRFSELIRLLDLAPLPEEGGWYRVTWKSSSGSAIFYLVTSDLHGFSAFHVLNTDEIYHFYAGDPVELHLLHPEGSHETRILGSHPERGETPQTVAPAGVVQGSRLASGGECALLGTTMAPAFQQDDFHLSTRAELLARFPSLPGDYQRPDSRMSGSCALVRLTPPSMRRSIPVIHAAASEARKRHAAPISSGNPVLPRGATPTNRL